MRAGKIFENLNYLLRAKRAKTFGKIGTPPPPPPILVKVKVRLFIFFPEDDILFSAFSRSEYLFQKKYQPPPPFRIKWSSPKLYTRSFFNV